MNMSVYVKVLKQPNQPFIHFHVIPNDELGYHSKEKMVVLPMMDSEEVWKLLTDFIEKQKESKFVSPERTTEGVLTRISSEADLFNAEELVKEIQKFFDENYPAHMCAF